MAATAGILVRVKVSGVAVPFTAEATTTSDNTTYTISTAAQRVLDPKVTVTVKDGGVATVEAYTLNRLRGTVTFGSANALRVITIDGSYLPMSVAAEATGIELSCIASNEDESIFGDSNVVRQQISKDCSGTVSRWKSTDTYFGDAFAAAAPTVVEVSRDSGASAFVRAWALWNKSTVNGATKGFEQESAAFEGTADADGRSFTWLE